VQCHVPEAGVRLEAIDTLYSAGRSGLRVMRAELYAEDFEVWTP